MMLFGTFFFGTILFLFEIFDLFAQAIICAVLKFALPGVLEK